MRFDAIIIGGGAAGLFCAVTAGKRGRRVLVIEHNSEPGRKILISGGGRCNFTNRSVSHENYISANPHFVKSALSRFTPSDIVKLIDRYGIAFYEKKAGQLFCRGSAMQVVEMLLTECRVANVAVETGCNVIGVKKDAGFTVETSRGKFSADKLVVACGGLSFPKVGATDLGYRIARRFGIKIVETRPSLVALTLADRRFAHLAGTSLNACVTHKKASFCDDVLFTHRGMSGPAILQISNYLPPRGTAKIDLLPAGSIDNAIVEARGSGRKVRTILSDLLPQRLVDAIVPAVLADKRAADVSKSDLETLIGSIHHFEAEFDGTEGYDRAEVTLGGVSTDELSSQTMAANSVNGLYFIGEVADVTGWLGGYNFQWAWSSGYAAGNSL
ncbi:MAG: NAD(P)/FAD-dependent oxidoreductase [Acidobacteria bacterium]|nr:NAD(P)/FAD-dependent oxidoreductase [Acidobacteriota bacterium]